MHLILDEELCVLVCLMGVRHFRWLLQANCHMYLQCSQLWVNLCRLSRGQKPGTPALGVLRSLRSTLEFFRVINQAFSFIASCRMSSFASQVASILRNNANEHSPLTREAHHSPESSANIHFFVWSQST